VRSYACTASYRQILPLGYSMFLGGIDDRGESNEQHVHINHGSHYQHQRSDYTSPQAPGLHLKVMIAFGKPAEPLSPFNEPHIFSTARPLSDRDTAFLVLAQKLPFVPQIGKPPTRARPRPEGSCTGSGAPKARQRSRDDPGSGWDQRYNTLHGEVTFPFI
jgi:hypothetical protein